MGMLPLMFVRAIFSTQLFSFDISFVEFVKMMPRPCAVETHVRRYKKATESSEMPHACPVEFHV
jgi:hypothetical protein